MSNTSEKTVLVVEDSPTQALHLRLLLEGEGLGVVCAADGRLGLELARRLQPDLIILDIHLPIMDGFQVCRQLKASADLACIPVIMFTRQDTPESVMQGLQQGVIDYIPKDAFATAVLLETLRQMGIIENGNSHSRAHR